MLESAGGCSRHGVGEAGSAPLGDHHSARTGRERSANHRAKIVRILDAIEEYDQAGPGVRNTQQVLESCRRLCGGKRHHALVLACAAGAIHLLALLEAHWHIVPARELYQSIEALAVAAARH
jgi:hypothetical protein